MGVDGRLGKSAECDENGDGARRPLGAPVNVLAFLYGIGAIANMAWPRTPQAPWYVDYSVLVATAGVLVLGAAYMLAARPYNHGDAPAGDAHLRQAGGKL